MAKRMGFCPQCGQLLGSGIKQAATRGRKPTEDSLAGEARVEVLALSQELTVLDLRELRDLRTLQEKLVLAKGFGLLGDLSLVLEVVDEAQKICVRLLERDRNLHGELTGVAELVLHGRPS